MWFSVSCLIFLHFSSGCVISWVILQICRLPVQTELLPSGSVLSWLNLEPAAFSGDNPGGTWAEFDVAESVTLQTVAFLGTHSERQMACCFSLEMYFGPGSRWDFGSLSLVKGQNCCWSSDGQHLASLSTRIFWVSQNCFATCFTSTLGRKATTWCIFLESSSVLAPN